MVESWITFGTAEFKFFVCRKNNGPQDVHALIPEHVTSMLHDKKGFYRLIKVMDLEIILDHPGGPNLIT